MVKTGVIFTESSAYGLAFLTLQSTSAAHLYNLEDFSDDLVATTDYAQTIKERAKYDTDDYLNPVQWIMSISDDDGDIHTLVIISHFEANALVNDIEKYNSHPSPLCPTTKLLPLLPRRSDPHGRPFNPHSVPPSLTMLLNIFAGSLYLRSHAEHVELCDFLGLVHDTPKNGQRVNVDGFITSSKRKWGLKVSPVPFLRVLFMKIRREGEGVGKTHLGKILSGIRLEEGVDWKVRIKEEPVEVIEID